MTLPGLCLVDAVGIVHWRPRDVYFNPEHVSRADGGWVPVCELRSHCAPAECRWLQPRRGLTYGDVTCIGCLATQGRRWP